MNFWSMIRPVFYLLIGLCLVIFPFINQPPPENKLILLEGAPTKVQLTKSRNRVGVEFRLSDMRINYTQVNPNYHRVSEIIQSGEPVKLWVMPDPWKKEIGILYKMTFKDSPIVNYDETVKAQQEKSNYMLIIGIVLSCIGAFSLSRKMKRG